MFLAGVVGGAGINHIDPEEERDPPQEATPISFPSVEAPQCRKWDDETPPPNFQTLFTQILKPADVSEAHLKALNIDIRPQSSVEELLPSTPDGSSYMPPLDQNEKAGGTSSYAAAASTDPGSARKRKDFEDRLTELRVDNVTAYHVITRSATPGVKPPRLAFMRNFWQGLESMSQYWDCTKDQYYVASEGGESGESGEKSPKRQKLDVASEENEQNKVDSGSDQRLAVRTAEDTNVAKYDKSANDPAPKPAASSSMNGESTQKSTETGPNRAHPSIRRSRMRYKGVRTSTGRQMPDHFRIDALRGFVEGAVWPFQCNAHPPRMMPLVHFCKLKLPIRQTVAVYRLPADRARARAGGIVGPIMGVQVRPEMEFGGDEGKARLDVVREIGGLLQIAQERAREEKRGVKPGEGKWWTTVPRWGGGPGGEVENMEGNSDVVATDPEALPAGKSEEGTRPSSKDAARKAPSKKKKPAELWKELRPGSGYFDPKTDYAAIGKEPDSPWDTVFLLSSLNHHISILKLTVHAAYTEYMLSGTMSDPLPQDPNWCRPVLQRSRWWDLFVMEERVEAFRGVWGVMEYLMRNARNGKEGKGKT